MCYHWIEENSFVGIDCAEHLSYNLHCWLCYVKTVRCSFSLSRLSKSNECFCRTHHNSCHPSLVPVWFPLWALSQQFMETDESVEKKNCARITIVGGWRLNLNRPYLNSICLSLAPWHWGERLALRPHPLSTELTGFKRKLQVPSPGLCQSRLELVSLHS